MICCISSCWRISGALSWIKLQVQEKGHNFPRCPHFTILALSNWIKLEVQKKKQILGVNTWQSPGFSNWIKHSNLKFRKKAIILPSVLKHIDSSKKLDFKSFYVKLSTIVCIEVFGASVSINITITAYTLLGM